MFRTLLVLGLGVNTAFGIPLWHCPDVMATLGRGDVTYRREKGRGAIEDRTRHDLKLEQVLLPLVDSTQTEPGRRRMRFLMENPFQDPKRIEARQQAAQELAEKPRLRNAIRRSLRRLRRAADDRTLSHLIDGSPLFRRYDQARLGASALGGYGLVPLATLSLTAPFGLGWASFVPGALNMGVQLPGVYSKRAQIRRYRRILRESQTLAKALLEAESPELREIGRVLQNTLKDEALGGLSNTVRLLDPVQHPLVTLVPDFLYGHSAHRLLPQSRALGAQRKELAHVLSAVGDLDVIHSFARMSAEGNGDFVFPRAVSARTPYMRIEQGHHPYQFAKNRSGSVPNDVTLGERQGDGVGNFLIVTGGNAEGKTSYLQMAALQAVLAQMGAPVPARSMEFTPLQPLTYKAPEDSMVEGKSSFQSESARVKQIVDRAKKGEPLLAVLDQMFDGTNPGQQLASEAAVVRYLARRGHLYLLATHDLPVTDLQDTTPGVHNAHMERYRLKDGPAHQGNAFEVMNSLDFPREIIEDARRIYDAHQQGKSLRDATGE